MKKVILANCVAFSVFLTGCSSDMSSVRPGDSKRIQKIATQGAALGCFGGAMLFTDSRKRNLKLLKCLIGASAGYMAGRSLAKRQASYRNLQDQINGEIGHTATLNTKLKAHVLSQKKDLMKYKANVAKLTRDEDTVNDSFVDIAKLYQELTKVDKDEQKEFQNLQKEFEYKRSTLQQAEANSYSQQARKLEKEIALLEQNIAALSQNRQRLASYKKQVTDVLL